MFGLGPATRIYVALGATDMRRASMDFTESCETSLDWKCGPGICFCLLMPEGTDSKSYTGTGRAFGVVPKG